MLTTEKRMYDCIILKNQAVHVCVYNAGWEGKEGGEKRGMSPIKFM